MKKNLIKYEEIVKLDKEIQFKKDQVLKLTKYNYIFVKDKILFYNRVIDDLIDILGGKLDLKEILKFKKKYLDFIYREEEIFDVFSKLHEKFYDKFMSAENMYSIGQNKIFSDEEFDYIIKKQNIIESQINKFKDLSKYNNDFIEIIKEENNFIKELENEIFNSSLTDNKFKQSESIINDYEIYRNELIEKINNIKNEYSQISKSIEVYGKTK